MCPFRLPAPTSTGRESAGIGLPEFFGVGSAPDCEGSPGLFGGRRLDGATVLLSPDVALNPVT